MARLQVVLWQHIGLLKAWTCISLLVSCRDKLLHSWEGHIAHLDLYSPSTWKISKVIILAFTWGLYSSLQQSVMHHKEHAMQELCTNSHMEKVHAFGFADISRLKDTLTDSCTPAGPYNGFHI